MAEFLGEELGAWMRHWHGRRAIQDFFQQRHAGQKKVSSREFFRFLNNPLFLNN